MCTHEKKEAPLPDGVEDEERVIKRRLLRVVFQGEEDGVTEPHPANQTKGDEAVAWRALVQV